MERHGKDKYFLGAGEQLIPVSANSSSKDDRIVPRCSSPELYSIIVILTITIFTPLDVNLQWVPLTRSIEGSFAMYICRFIVIPLEILLSACVLISHLKVKWRWLISATILLFLCLEDRVYLWFDLIVYRKWNEFYSALMYAACFLVSFSITP